jgi:hypothetical protein
MKYTNVKSWFVAGILALVSTTSVFAFEVTPTQTGQSKRVDHRGVRCNLSVNEQLVAATPLVRGPSPRQVAGRVDR